MKRMVLLVLVSVFSLSLSGHVVLANPFTGGDKSAKSHGRGRYILKIMNGRAIRNTRVPALVLDSVMGVVWTCQNLQDGKPLWVRADLGQNGDESLTRKKYVVKMLEWQDADLRMPAIVLDIDKGIVWTCQNIVDGKAMWIQRDLTSGASMEITREEISVVKTGK